MSTASIQTRLHVIGQLDDEEVPLAETLILLGALEHGKDNVDVYKLHITELRQALQDEIDNHLTPDPNVHWQLERLNNVIQKQFGYHEDELHEGFSDPDQINFLDTIDTRSGIPVALGALYMDLAQGQGWEAHGINFPGHFLFRLEQGRERIIIDPFHGGTELNAGALRQLLKKSVGPEAELSHEYYNTVTNREVVLRFCNNRKTRLIELMKYAEAMEVIAKELWIAPNESRLYFDAGVIATKLEHIQQAIDYLQKFTEMSNHGTTLAQARKMLDVLRRHLQ